MKKIKYRNIKKDHEKQGFVLIVGVILMAFMLLLAVPFMFQLSSDYRLTKKSSGSLTALYLAEAGIERAIWELNNGDVSSWSGDDTLRTMTISGFQTAGGETVGDIQISVTEPGGYNPIIESSGSIAYSGSQTVARTVRVELEMDSYIPFEYGIFSDGIIDAGIGCDTDSYDSRLGNYGGSNVGSEGDIGTNSTADDSAILWWFSDIYGDVYVGPGADPDAVIDDRFYSEIHGEKLVLSEEKELLSIPAPEGLPVNGDYTLIPNGVDTISESGEYTNFRLSQDSTLTITSDVVLYVTGQFGMDMNSNLEIADGASLKIILDGGEANFYTDPMADVNNVGRDPTKLMILGTDEFTGEIELTWRVDFYGGVYLPKATIHAKWSVDFYGSITAAAVEFSFFADMHYDVAMKELSISTLTLNNPYTLRSWQEIFSP